MPSPSLGDLMSFIKRGDGKILSVYDEEELSEQQKKSVKDHTDKLKKDSVQNTETTKKLEG